MSKRRLNPPQRSCYFVAVTFASASKLAEACWRLLSLLPGAERQSAAQWKMEGYINEEIAGKLGCALPRSSFSPAPCCSRSRLASGPDPRGLQEQEQDHRQDGSHCQGHQHVQGCADWPASAGYPRCARSRKGHNRSRVHRSLLPGISPPDTEDYRIRRTRGCKRKIGTNRGAACR
jgi:hypothetical protein